MDGSGAPVRLWARLWNVWPRPFRFRPELPKAAPCNVGSFACAPPARLAAVRHWPPWSSNVKVSARVRPSVGAPFNVAVRVKTLRQLEYKPLQLEYEQVTCKNRCCPEGLSMLPKAQHATKTNFKMWENKYFLAKYFKQDVKKCETFKQVKKLTKYFAKT